MQILYFEFGDFFCRGPQRCRVGACGVDCPVVLVERYLYAFCASECSLRVPALNHFVVRSLATVHTNIVQYESADGKRYANAIASLNIVNKSRPSGGMFPAAT